MKVAWCVTALTNLSLTLKTVTNDLIQGDTVGAPTVIAKSINTKKRYRHNNQRQQ